MESKLTSSLERIYPDLVDKDDVLGKEALSLHLQRYQFAMKHLLPGLIADAACGAGYGSYKIATEMSDNIEKVIAVDIDESVIDYSRQRYAHPLIEYHHADLLHFTFEKPPQTIISLETIEHLPDPKLFVKKMCEQLTTGGRFIASAPVTPSVDANPYHLHDFSQRSFRKLFTDAGMKEIDALLQVQKFNPLQVTNKAAGRRRDIRKGLLRYYFKHPGSLWRRIRSISTDGFTNKYLVVAFEKI